MAVCTFEFLWHTLDLVVLPGGRLLLSSSASQVAVIASFRSGKCHILFVGDCQVASIVPVRMPSGSYCFIQSVKWQLLLHSVCQVAAIVFEECQVASIVSTIGSADWFL